MPDTREVFIRCEMSYDGSPDNAISDKATSSDTLYLAGQSGAGRLNVTDPLAFPAAPLNNDNPYSYLRVYVVGSGGADEGVYCATGKNPDPRVEPRLFLRVREEYTIRLKAGDRVSFTAAAYLGAFSQFTP